MDTLDILASLDEAIRILRTVSNTHHLASGSNTIWRLVDHAQDHLDRQMRDLLASPAEPEHRCIVDLETDLCTGCGVEHSESCPGCAGRGYHAASCARIEDWARN